MQPWVAMYVHWAMQSRMLAASRSSEMQMDRISHTQDTSWMQLLQRYRQRDRERFAERGE